MKLLSRKYFTIDKQTTKAVEPFVEMAAKSKIKLFFKRIFKLFVKLVICLIVFTFLQVLALKFIDPPTTPNVAWEWAESIIKHQPEKKPKYEFVPIEQISPHLRRAVITAEDQRFLLHNGFDFKEIKRAVTDYWDTGRVRGASTISMQTARSVFLLSSKSGFRKIAEAYYTFLIELLWSKERILEMYLNTVDWGTGITGAQAAAQTYFSRSADQLNPAQAALMAAVLPNPHKWSAKKPSLYVRMRQARILKDMLIAPLL